MDGRVDSPLAQQSVPLAALLPLAATCQPLSQLCLRPALPSQVWQVISQRQQQGVGGLARLHSTLISTGEE